MSEVEKASGQGGNIAWVTGRLARLIRAAGNRMFKAEDAHARQYGWQAMVRRGGLARTYRDPRFDRFRGCPVCRSTGTGRAERPCDHCGGTGRVTVSPPTLADGGRE
jgi:RecJ-like exonuclease